jgi:hypothetical protein
MGVRNLELSLQMRKKERKKERKVACHKHQLAAGSKDISCEPNRCSAGQEVP